MVKQEIAYIMESVHLEDQHRSGIILIKTKLGETGCEDGRIIELVQDHVQRQSVG